jgi:hypothetical protein
MSFVNMIYLEKSDSPVFQTGCSSFSDCSEKTECSSLSNQTVRSWVNRTYDFLALISMYLLSYASRNTCSHTQLLHI